MDSEKLRRRGEITLACVIHTMKIVQSLFVETEQLCRAPNLVAFQHLSVVGDVRFHGERRKVRSIAIVEPDSEFVPKGVRRVVKHQDVEREVHMSVVVGPIDRDGAAHGDHRHTFPVDGGQRGFVFCN